LPHASKFRKAPAFSSPLGKVFSVLLDRRAAGHGKDTLVAFYYPDMIQNKEDDLFGVKWWNNESFKLRSIFYPVKVEAKNPPP
jgi:hypothetical protein